LQFKGQRCENLPSGHSCQAVTENYAEMMDWQLPDWRNVEQTLLQCVTLSSKNLTWSPRFECKASQPKAASDHLNYRIFSNLICTRFTVSEG